MKKLYYFSPRLVAGRLPSAMKETVAGCVNDKTKREKPIAIETTTVDK